MTDIDARPILSQRDETENSPPPAELRRKASGVLNLIFNVNTDWD